jgi:hypothetical protein
VSEPREAARNRRLRAVHGSPAEQATIDRGRAEDRRVPKPDRVLAPHTLTPAEFAAKWSDNTQTEKATAQEHFIDLCRMVGVPTPNEHDPSGADYAFEKGVAKTAGGDGFADVWRRGYFAWEYKRKKKDLDAAYAQLLQYREAPENPPILVVCDLNRFVVRTNFTNTPTTVYEFSLNDLLTSPKEPLRILRAVMEHPGLPGTDEHHGRRIAQGREQTGIPSWWAIYGQQDAGLRTGRFLAYIGMAERMTGLAPSAARDTAKMGRFV